MTGCNADSDDCSTVFRRSGIAKLPLPQNPVQPCRIRGYDHVFFAQIFFRFMALCPDSAISRIIRSKSDTSALHLAV